MNILIFLIGLVPCWSEEFPSTTKAESWTKGPDPSKSCCRCFTWTQHQTVGDQKPGWSGYLKLFRNTPAKKSMGWKGEKRKHKWRCKIIGQLFLWLCHSSKFSEESIRCFYKIEPTSNTQCTWSHFSAISNKFPTTISHYSKYPNT